MNNKPKNKHRTIKRQLALPSGNLTSGEVDELMREDYNKQVTLAEEEYRRNKGRYILREEY